MILIREMPDVYCPPFSMPENPASASPNAPICPASPVWGSALSAFAPHSIPWLRPRRSGYAGLSRFLWPHLAYRLACRAKDPFKAEIRNLLIDSAFGGFWAAMMAFNALPAIVILSMMSMNNIASAGKALFVKGLAIQLAAAARPARCSVSRSTRTARRCKSICACR